MRIRWRGLELPSKVICERSTLSSYYGKFSIEPFERGFGISVGNSLRRVLLSSLEGSAVTRMKLRGALHEFISLPGVKEDVTEIALNVKSIVVRCYEEKPRLIRIEKNTAGPITAADIITDGVVEVINQDHYIATLTSDVPFELEMVVENGRGYIPASEQMSYIRDRGDSIGFIPLDAAFSPVCRVQYAVEETRVGQKTNFDKLNMQIWTDGSIDPEMALVEAAKILRKHLNPFIQYDRLGAAVYAKAKISAIAGIDPALEAKLVMTLAELNLSVRAMNCLEAENINTVRELVSQTEDSLLEVRNFGETTLNEVKDKLTSIGLRLGMRIPAPSAQQVFSSAPFSNM
ncbi:MAG: DNA-directed RNA polymerase subunit alpha [Planctomycetaceae bacterium]|jgi:DNA-directed RNA polymerase subunit alpha|nr:DNA-directed RNA polymerase subunit alpha [Planctomycetaceae bacterium]